MRLMLFTSILDLIQTKSKKLLLMKMVSSNHLLLSMILVVVRPLMAELYDIEEAHFYENGK